LIQRSTSSTDAFPEHQNRNAALFCEPCVYFIDNLDPALFSADRDVNRFCGLDADPDNSLCREIHTGKLRHPETGITIELGFSFLRNAAGH
jgi:hypothetical protein